MNKPLDLLGKSFGKMKVVSRSDNNTHGKSMWLCQCECGAQKSVLGSKLLSGETRSCGCLMVQAVKIANSTHGQSSSRTYRIWQNMKARCRNPNRPDYSRYGGAGITVCDRWKGSFASFLLDMGECAPDQTLDRIDNSLGYEPGNCRWATYKEQADNSSRPRVISFGGYSMNVTEWANHLGISQPALHERLQKWPLEKALSRGKWHRSKRD